MKVMMLHKLNVLLKAYVNKSVQIRMYVAQHYNNQSQMCLSMLRMGICQHLKVSLVK